MADDEMGAWLHHYTEELYSELLGQNQTTIPPPHTEAPAQQFLYNMVGPPQYPPSTVSPPITSTPSLNFQMFSRMRGKGSEARSNSTVAAEAVVKSGGEASSGFVGGLGRDSVFERVSSSLGTSGDPISSACTTTTTVLNYTTSEEGGDKMVEVEDRKRKQKQKQPEIDPSTTTATSVMYYEDVEAHDASNYNMKDSWGLLHPTKRTRAAEVHNLSERKRRDKINEKMKALQELVPQCNKSDKASMLDEVIEYLKSLQMQLQIMSVGCGMVPMTYPGMQQQFMPPVMGMGMGMDRPMIPYSSNTPGFNFQNSLAIGTGPQNRPVRMPSVAAASSMSVNQGDYVPVQNPNLVDSYQQYMALQQMQMRMRMQVVQDQSISRLGSSNNEDQPMPSTSKSDGEDDQ